MTTGSEIYDEIQGKVREVENQSSEIGKKIQTAQSSTRVLSVQQEESYLQLALVYLPEMEARAVKDTIVEAKAEVQRIFDSKNKRRVELEELVEDSTTQRGKLQARLRKVTIELDETSETRTQLTLQVKRDLSKNPTYVELDEKNKFATQRLKQDEIRAETFQKEAKTKLSAYESNNLFMYLARRKFGTSEQQGNNLTRILDSFVAKVVNYGENIQNYEFLKAMPQRISEEIATETKQVAELKMGMQKLEKDTADKYKLFPVIEECKLMEQTRGEIESSIASIDADFTKYRTEIAQIDDKKGAYHSAAIKKLRDYLSGETLSELKERARKTPGKEDDGIVEKIEYISAQFEAEKEKINQMKRKQAEIQKKVEGLRTIERNFTSKDYESRRSVFDSSFDIHSVLTGYLLGKYSTSTVDSQIGNNQHFKPTETYHSSSSSSSHDYSSSSSSGGFSSGGGFGGGGSSTGGGF